MVTILKSIVQNVYRNSYKYLLQKSSSFSVICPENFKIKQRINAYIIILWELKRKV